MGQAHLPANERIRDKAMTKRFAAVSTSAVVGALCGIMLAAFASVISGSLLAVLVTILLCTAIGAWTGRLTGAVLGAMGGVLATAFGYVLSSTPLSVVLTIVACALLGGWLRWVCERRKDAISSRTDDSASAPVKEAPTNRIRQYLVHS
jgi:hypothetical protein